MARSPLLSSPLDAANKPVLHPFWHSGKENREGAPQVLERGFPPQKTTTGEHQGPAEGRKIILSEWIGGILSREGWCWGKVGSLLVLGAEALWAGFKWLMVGLLAILAAYM